MPPARRSRSVALATATAAMATAILAALLLAGSVSGGASAAGARNPVAQTAASSQGPARAHAGGQLGGKHARVGSTTSMTDHLKIHQLDLASTPPADDVDVPRSSVGDVETTAQAAVVSTLLGPDSRGPPAV